MNPHFDLSIEISEKYNFNNGALTQIAQNPWVKNQWPLVYFIENEIKANKREAYVGESTNFSERIKNHLSNPKREKLTHVTIIGSDKFNKSATLDIEQKLIQYIGAEETFALQNIAPGLNHNYYQQDRYKDLFKEIWNKLSEKKIVSKSLDEIANSQVFKYSPYKSLNRDQFDSVMKIIEGLTKNGSGQIFIQGSAGTGKTILATYLIKLLCSDISSLERGEIKENEAIDINLIKAFKLKYPNAKIGLVIAMTSLRKTLQNVFKQIPGLKQSMVISPSNTFKKEYDLLIVDEAHRLRQCKNICWMGTFKENNKKLGLDDTGNELDWIIANSQHQIFFYDSCQSVKPSDIDSECFDRLLNKENTLSLELKSQMRIQGKSSNDYITFVDDLLNVNLPENINFRPDNHELLLFDSLKDLYEELSGKEKKYQLCRLISGYSWEWLSDPKRKPPTPDAIDIKIDGLELQWNKQQDDWVNSKNAFKEVGCIHTTQGYDLNYAGIIFGKEIKFNKENQSIEIDKEKYFDKNGKKGVENIEDLKSYIINIYKTLMYRGIRGTFIYACDENLRDYLKKFILYKPKEIEINRKLKILSFDNVIPYKNAVPLLDITVAAGDFSDLQIHSDYDWIELPLNIAAKEGYFACKVIGESMNRKIPNGSLCLFKKDTGGSREGKIVLVEHHNIQDPDYSSGYTIKLYSSEKIDTENGFRHKKIVLKPLSHNPEFNNIILYDDEDVELNVCGIFVTILE